MMETLFFYLFIVINLIWHPLKYYKIYCVTRRYFNIIIPIFVKKFYSRIGVNSEWFDKIYNAGDIKIKSFLGQTLYSIIIYHPPRKALILIGFILFVAIIPLIGSILNKKYFVIEVLSVSVIRVHPTTTKPYTLLFVFHEYYKYSIKLKKKN